MAFENVGVSNLGTVAAPSAGGMFTMDAAGIASGQAFLVSELEKRDTLVRTPLTSFTYTRDVPIRVGGGWVDTVSAIDVDYGVTGGSGEGIVHAGGADGIPMVQANFGKNLYKAHGIAVGTRVQWVDMQKGNLTGRNLDTMLRDGVRMTYDKHMDANTYVGFSIYGTTGLINNANVTIASAGATFAASTADAILSIINTNIIAAWAAAGYDLDAIPNHILMPYEQYNLIATTQVSSVAEKSILTYLLENNIAAKNGVELFIGATKYCDGGGAGGADRMVIYCNKERYIAMDELVPLTRAMTSPNTEHFCYDTAYAGNVSELEIFYPQTIIYVDGI